jgi:hypothetical protein
MVVSASRKGRLQSSESRVGKDYAGRSRVGDRHGYISKQERQKTEFRIGTDLKIMQIGQGQGTDILVSVNRKGRVQSH